MAVSQSAPVAAAAESTGPVHLKRELTLWPLVFMTLAYIGPLVGLAVFGVVAVASNGTVPTSFIFCSVAMLFTALTYGRLSRRFPVAGSAYTYVRRAIDSRVGFMAGWAILLDYFFLPMVAWLLGALYLHAQFPSVPTQVFLAVMIVVTTIINIIGIRLAANINYLLTIGVLLVIVAFIVLSITHQTGAGAPILSTAPFWNELSTFAAVSAGAAIAAYSFLGFDACTTLTEETHNAKVTTPRAVLLSAVVAAAIFIVTTYFAQLVHPGAEFTDPGSGSFEIAKDIGGTLFSSIFLAGVVLGQFTGGIPIQAAGARLLYAMARDGVFPKKGLSYVNPRFHTPVVTIVLTAIVSIPAFFVDILTLASFINFGAFTAYTLVNISLIVLAFRERESRPKAWLITMGLFPLAGAAVCVWLLSKLDINAVRIGGVWITIGFVWLIVLTKGFRVAPPQMDFSEEEEILAEDVVEYAPAHQVV